jgi:hypothetical protein
VLQVKAMILRGIFLLREKELLWFYQDGASWIFPDIWEKYLAAIPPVIIFDYIMSGVDSHVLFDTITTHRWSEAT